MTLAEFLLARITEDEAPTWRLEPYRCPPGCCAPGDWVGHECLICRDGVTYGGTRQAMRRSAIEHADRVHRSGRVAAECKAKRRIVEDREHLATVPGHGAMVAHSDWTLRQIASVYADHPDFDEAWLA